MVRILRTYWSMLIVVPFLLSLLGYVSWSGPERGAIAFGNCGIGWTFGKPEDAAFDPGPGPHAEFYRTLSFDPALWFEWGDPYYSVPLWPMVLLAIGLNIFQLRRGRHRGGCAQCGYSRSGLAATARCPECGR